MKIEYIYELLEYYELDYNIIIDENTDEIILDKKDEFYDITEFLSENYISQHSFNESYDSITIKLNLIENKEIISDIYELMLNKIEIENYIKLLENNSDYYDCINRLGKYENELGTNKLNDIINEFHLNHKNYYSFNLINSSDELYEFITDIIDESELYNKFNYVIYSNLDELYDSYDKNELYNKFKRYSINISDESNILLDYNKHEIRNIDKNDIDSLIKYVIKNNFFNDENKLIESKINEFIELHNVFYDYIKHEILDNNEYNLKYIHNKNMISFNSFIKYSNQDEFILLDYTKTDENKSLNESELIEMSDELLSDIIDSYEYYEYDSYEFNEFIKILTLFV